MVIILLSKLLNDQSCSLLTMLVFNGGSLFWGWLLQQKLKQTEKNEYENRIIMIENLIKIQC